MTIVTEKEGREMCEAMCKVVDAGTRTVKQLGETFGRFAELARATDEEISEFKKRIKQIE